MSREVGRNGGRDAYRVHAAQERAESLVARPKVSKLVSDRRLHDEVAAGLAKEWSPEQIAGRLVEDFPAEPRMRVSHETIYQTLYLQARGELATELKVALRQGRAQRRPRGSTRLKQARVKDMVNISERPAEAADRAVPGHWEGDLIIGKSGKSQVATLVDRTARFLMLVRIPYDRTADRVAARLSTQMADLPDLLKRSLTLWGSRTRITTSGEPFVRWAEEPRAPSGPAGSTGIIFRDLVHALTCQIEQTQAEIDTLTAHLDELSEQIEHLRISRKTLISLAEEDPDPAEPAATPPAIPDHPAYQQILTVFSEAGGSLRTRDLAMAMDLPLTQNAIQNVRAKLKRLASRSILVETEPGLFIQPRR
ncbi:IS30 family transposase [Nonomuraea sp. K274]|uniref:IS30 family transposase n=1 Tax=Nonomuraea cypriaca TaxID=1187855 RepID=A0A931F4A8_9ACTN|nr:IS30 family transposase [Nonomuraea cypriaca]